MLIYCILGILCFPAIACSLLVLPAFSNRARLKPYLGTDFAHRGLHNIKKGIPENSMPAFREAIRHRLGIELDIHLTRDKKVVVFHDESLQRICHAKGDVEDFTYEELQKLYLSGTDEHMPLFQDVLELVNGRVPLLIELKLPSKSVELCAVTHELLKSYKGAYLIQSFNSLGVRWYRKHAPQILRGQLSSALTQEKHLTSPLWVRFLVEHLLTNAFCRPDFISYKLADSHNLSVLLLHRMFKTPTAVWTLRTKEAYKRGKREFDICIFEEPARNLIS